MDIFVLPSLSEGIPMALLEAMALGKPVVATAVGGVPEVIQDGVTGMLVEPDDERALADACLQLRSLIANGPSTAGARGRRLVEERFSHEGSGRALLAAYRSVALIPHVGTRHMGDRRREHPDRQPSSTDSLTGPRCASCPGTHRRGAAASPARSRNRLASRTGTSIRPIGPVHLCGGLARAAVERASRKVSHWVARRAMRRLRRISGSIAARVQSARSVLMVCHGNIIRSPFAAQVVKGAVNGSKAVSVASAGLEAVPGKPAHPKAVQVATCATGRPRLSRGQADHPASSSPQSDVIFVMDIPQLVTLRRRFPEAGRRTFLLTCLAPDTPLEVADPVDGDDAVFRGCFEHITRATRPLIRAFAPPAH